jgi:cysteine desulfurase / selenocysteine lyase
VALPDPSFGPFQGHVWLNAAHQGPLPQVAVEAARRALEHKIAPHLIADDDFHGVPTRLRGALARLINASANEIALGNSATHGLQLIANGLSWQPGDEVLVPADDFPASILPWTVLEPEGVVVRRLSTIEGELSVELLASELTDRTKIVCVSWINSFSGRVNDVRGLGALCRERGVWFVLNASQGLGARSLDVTALPVDALSSCGFKWLCGPYGTGFCWLHPELLSQLDPHQAYWLTLAGEQWSELEELPTSRDDLGAAAFDVFGTANFFNFGPWSAVVEHFLETGLDAIQEHNTLLIRRLSEGVDHSRWRLVNADTPPESSSMLVLEPLAESTEAVMRRLTNARIEVAERRGRIRISPHLYNSTGDIDKALTALA